MSGGMWVDCRDKLPRLIDEADNVLIQLDQLAHQWGDEGVFRRCRDRLRKAIEDALVYAPTGIPPAGT